MGFVKRRVSSMAKTFVFGISTSQPASGLTNMVSSRSSRNVPRTLSSTLPRPSCTTTGRPIQGSNVLPIAFPRVCLFSTRQTSTSAKAINTVRNDRYCALTSRTWLIVQTWHSLVVHTELDFLKACFEAGASEYVLKPQLAADLLFAIRAALAQHCFTSPNLMYRT